MNIRLRQLRTFKAIVDHGSVSEAALALNLTQSSLSKSLANFEAELGFLLFDRIGRRLSLSVQGRAFLDQAINSIELLEGLETAAMNIRDNLGARFRLAAIGPIVLSGLLPRAIAEFSQQRPDVEFAIETKNRAEMEDWVAGGKADIGLTVFPVHPNRFGARQFARVKAVTVLPAGHHLAEKSVLSPGDLEGENVIMPRLAARVRNLVESSFLQAGHMLRPKFETTTAVAAAHLVAAGNGVAVLDPFTVTGLPTDKVVVVPWQPEIELRYGMIWPGYRGMTGLDRDLGLAVEKTVQKLSRTFDWFEAL